MVNASAPKECAAAAATGPVWKRAILGSNPTCFESSWRTLAFGVSPGPDIDCKWAWNCLGSSGWVGVEAFFCTALAALATAELLSFFGWLAPGPTPGTPEL